jgi:3-hydroxyacyl-CoA dehydrogenase
MVQLSPSLEKLRSDPARVVAETAGASLLDLDDGILCLEFHSKGNTLDGDTLTVAERAFEVIPGAYRGLVVGNQGSNFSFGANLKWILSLIDQVGDDRAAFRTAAKRFQRVTTGVRTCPFPVVAAPFNLTVGGALELSMYCDRIQAHAGMKAFLPEAAVGILPDLGGTSELYARAVEHFGKERPDLALRHAFETIVYAKRSDDAESARGLLFLGPLDRVTRDLPLLIADAKARAVALANDYVPREQRAAVPVLGEMGFRAVDAQVSARVESGEISEHDGRIARAIATVMTGGGGPPRTISQNEMLDLETEWFESLIFTPQTRERMEHMLATGEALRN